MGEQLPQKGVTYTEGLKTDEGTEAGAIKKRTEELLETELRNKYSYLFGQ